MAQPLAPIPPVGGKFHRETGKQNFSHDFYSLRRLRITIFLLQEIPALSNQKGDILRRPWYVEKNETGEWLVSYPAA